MMFETLPNEFHPGGRCFCGACLALFPGRSHERRDVLAIPRTQSTYTLADLGLLVTAGDSSSELKRMAVSLAFEMGRNAGIVEAAEAVGKGLSR